MTHSSPSKVRPGLGLLAVLCSILAVGALDYATGLYVTVEPFYLVPIAVAAWWFGPRAAGLAILVSVITAFAVEYSSVYDYPLATTVWNASARGLVLGVIAMLLHRLRMRNAQIVATRDQLSRALEQETRASRTDALTGLANRRCFVEALERAVERHATQTAIAFLDLDDFKAVNDRFGHVAGDELLRTLASHLGRAVREGDLAARLGGDEFAVLFHRARPELVQSALERMIDVARQVAGRYPGTGVGLSVGVVRFPVAPPCVEEMLKAADGAMYRAKRAGKGRIVVDWAAEQASVFEAPVPVPENT